MARQYKTGWVWCTDWNVVKFGATPGQDITHGLGVTPENIQARVYIKLNQTGYPVREVLEDNVIFQADANSTTTVTVKNLHSNGVQYKESGGAQLIFNGTGAWYQTVLDNTSEAGLQGPTGPAGADGVDGQAGTTYVVYASDWDSATSYAVGDICYYDGNVYKCIQASTNNQPDTATTYWEAVPQTYTSETEPNAVDGALWIKGE